MTERQVYDLPPPPGEYDAPLPADPEAEELLVGALLIDPGLVPKVRETVRGSMFRTPWARAYAELLATVDAGEPIDVVGLRNRLQEAGRLSAIGGEHGLARAVAGVPRSADAHAYAHRIAAKDARRRLHLEAAQLASDALNGVADARLHARAAELAEIRAGSPASRAKSMPLYSPDNPPTETRWLVRGLIPEAGFAMVWAQPGTGKTYTTLRMVHELLAEPQASHLWGHPELSIEGNVRRVLWIATEETAGGLRAKADRVLAGLGNPGLRGEIVHIFAADPHAPVSLLDLPDLLDAHGPVDLAVLDSLTGLRPKAIDGERVKWDADNDAANAQCLMLRGLAESRRCTFLVVHHTGRDTSKGYRGPTDWWASVDVMFGLKPDAATRETQVVIEKVRDGRRLPTFRLAQDWTRGAYVAAYSGETVSGPELSRTAQAVIQRLTGRPAMSQAELVKALPEFSRSSIQDGIRRAAGAGLLRFTGEERSQSPVVEWVPEGAAGEDEP